MPEHWPVKAIEWIGGLEGYLQLIDQRRLPADLVQIRCKDLAQLCDAIKTMAIRGAPAIGVSAGFGMVLALQGCGHDLKQALGILHEAAGQLIGTRPTAVNLAWAVERVLKAAEGLVAARPDAGVDDLRQAVFQEAMRIWREDVEACHRIGLYGSDLIKEGMAVLTHCNAGALATAGQGTAISVIYEAHKQGRSFTVYVDETRPLLQGARLTAWELAQARIRAVVICDDMAGWLMRQGMVSVVLTGADRIAANGDTANKIGTYSLAVLAARHSIPFYVAAPLSTFDLATRTGQDIPIEQRAGEEVRQIGGTTIVPDGIEVWNPAFDVTDARLITAIITDAGIIERPSRRNIEAFLRRSGPRRP